MAMFVTSRRQVLTVCAGSLIPIPALPWQTEKKSAAGQAGVNEVKLPTVFTSEDLIAAPCIDTDVPGYLVLRATTQHKHLYETTAGFQRELGVVLGRLELCISSVTEAQHVYIARFSEASSSVHFHLFPRTAKLATDFLRENPTIIDGVNGPLLFDWARRKYHVDDPEKLSAATISTAQRIASAYETTK